MILSQTIERERKFKLALRARLPILTLISLIIYSIFQKENIALDAKTTILLISSSFITVYFIFLLLK